MTYSSHVIKKILTFEAGYGVIVRNINLFTGISFSKEAKRKPCNLSGEIIED